MKQRRRDWFDAPPRDLYTAADAERVLGIPARAVRKWAHRQRLHAAGLLEDDRPVYDKVDLVALWERSATRRAAA